MKKILFAFALILLMVVSAVPVSAAENEYGIVHAWFNGKNATVEGIKLKIGEPAEIKVDIASKISGNIYIELYEPGPTKDQAFDILNGPSKQNERINNLKIETGWSKTYTWTIAPNGNWSNGNAPINIWVQFSKQGDKKELDFTIVNPYILDEQYSTPAAAPAQSAAPASQNNSSQTSQPFPYLYLILVGAAVIVIIVLFKMRKPK